MNIDMKQNDGGLESPDNGGSKSKVLLISGIALLAVGSLVAAAARLRGKIDLDQMQERVRSKKWPLLKSNGSSGSENAEEISGDLEPENDLTKEV